MRAHREWFRLGLICLLATHVSIASSALAQTYPAGPVKFITQLAAGSGTDPAMRIVTDRLGKIWGQQSVLVNQPGAGGAIAGAIGGALRGGIGLGAELSSSLCRAVISAIAKSSVPGLSGGDGR